ncbi:ankyrin repeat-containing domain protein [Mycena vulgaris]|nr:ankyrin repeat-containing domain protein [Mycena vulgaris]
MDSWDMGRQQQNDHDDQQRQLGLILSEAESEKQRAEATKRAEINGWITPLIFFQRQNDIFASWQPGTGEWLLVDTQFQEWNSGSGKILWCRGMAGAGKTVLVSMVVDHLRGGVQDGKTCVACIYLNHKETSTHTTPNLFTSLWKQLVGKPIPPEATQLYDNHHERSSKPSLDEILQILRSAIAEYSKVYLIIDALDEYPEPQRNILLEYLSTMIGPTINLMLTSRPHIALQPSFPKLDILEIRAAEDDICRYIEMRVLKSPRLSKHVRTRPELHGEIRSKILTNVEGMFLLAKLHIESLATKNTVKAVREALQHLPQDLNHTYDEAMERINHQSVDDRQLALLVLTWAAYAVRPLSVAELREALAVEPGTTTLDVDNLLDIDIILSVCAGLITVDEIKSAVRLIHYSTQDYFDRIRLVQFPDAHTTIPATCLTYLSFTDFSNLPDSLDDCQKMMLEHPLLSYSSYCLMHAAGDPELRLQNEIIFFLKRASSWRHLWFSVLYGRLEPPWNHPGWEHISAWPLCVSAAFNLLGIASHLLTEEPVQINDSFDALCVASYYGHLEMVQLLVKYGADMEHDTQGRLAEALQAAAEAGHEAVVRVLIEAGADVNMRGGLYETALIAAARGGQEPLVRLLMKNGADLYSEAKYYGTALHAASAKGHELVAMVQLLINMGADVNAEGPHSGTALQAAAHGGHESVVRLLIEMGANVNMRGGEFMGTPLQAASATGHESVARLLIEKGADVNAFGGFRGTALQAASLHGHESVVQLLIDNDADVNACAISGATALDAALLIHNESIVQLLLCNGADTTKYRM